MSLPSGVSTARVSFGQAVTAAGQPADVVFTITPTHTVVHAASGTTITPLADTFAASSGVGGTVDLPHTDQPGFVDAAGDPFTGWAYVIEGYWKRGASVAPFRREFQLLRGQREVDLDLIPAGPTRPAVAAPTRGVTSVNGQTGAVVLDLATGGGPTTAELATVRGEAQAASAAAREAASIATSASTAAGSANTRAGTALTTAASATATAGAVAARVDALKPGQPGGVVTTDAAGRIPASAIPPLPGAGLVIVPLAGHPRYLTLVQ